MDWNGRALQYLGYEDEISILKIHAHLFFSKESQYLASNSGDFEELCACLVTKLLFMNLPQACKNTKQTSLF